jgi:NADPH:quinone reductase-like Zn-dependent oxidoreductase
LSDWVAEDPVARRFDVVIDCVGGDGAGESIAESWTFAKAGGVVISIAQPPDITKPSQGVEDGVKSVWFIVDPNGKQLETLGKLVVEGTITPVIDSVTSLRDWGSAWERVSSGHARGKVVLTVDDSA